MSKNSPSASRSVAAAAPALPEVVERSAFQVELDGLRAREKAHTREGDALAAASSSTANG